MGSCYLPVTSGIDGVRWIESHCNIQQAICAFEFLPGEAFMTYVDTDSSELSSIFNNMTVRQVTAGYLVGHTA